MPASIFNGTAVKILKNILKFADGKTISSSQAEAAARMEEIQSDTFFVTGFVNPTDTTLACDTSGNVTITPTGASFDIYSSGVKYTKTTVNYSIPAFAANTLYFVYFDTSGNLTSSTTAWTLRSGVTPCMTVYYNGTAASVRVGDERHKAIRNLAWHSWAHETIGTRYKSGLDVVSLTSSTSQFSSGIIEDEDIVLNIGAQTDNNLISYRDPTLTFVTYDDAVSQYSAKIDGGVLKYDNAGTITAVTNNYYVKNQIYATNELSVPIVVIVGQEEHENLTNAREDHDFSRPSFISAESRLLYNVIWKNDGGTPTLIEYDDYRTSPTRPDGLYADIPLHLHDLLDVDVNTAQANQLLGFNGTYWVNVSAATGGVGVGSTFYNATPIITATGANNDIQIGSLSKTPVVTAEQTVSATAASNTVTGFAWLYDTALNRTSIDAGLWTFNSYVGVNSVAAGRVTTMTRTIYKVSPYTSPTVTITGAGTSRTATASGGTPFAVAKIDASATNTTASFLQTPLGLYQITARTSDTEVTILTPTTYSNESAVAFSVWKKLFAGTSAAITSITPAYTSNQYLVAASSYAIATTDKLGIINFVTSNNTTTVTTTYDGTSRNSNVLSSLSTKHNEISGLQGGSGDEYYHLTSSQHTIATQASSGSQAGYLSSADWTTFNNKQPAWTTSAKSSTFTAANNTIYLVDSSGGSFNIQLPTPAAGLSFYIKDTNKAFLANPVTLVRAGTEKIENVQASYVLSTNSQAARICSDGTDWFLIAEYRLPTRIELIWNNDGTYACPETTLFKQKCYEFADGETQEISCALKVPVTWPGGRQIFLRVKIFCGTGSNTALLTSVSTLIGSGVALSSTTNQRTSTNTALTLNATANVEGVALLDITDSSGKINSVSVVGGDTILITLTRGTGTNTNPIYFMPSTVEVVL